MACYMVLTGEHGKIEIYFRRFLKKAPLRLRFSEGTRYAGIHFQGIYG